MPEEPNSQPINVPQEEVRFNSLINSMADGVIALDANCRVSLYNAAALNLLDLNVNVQGVQLGAIMKLFDNKNEQIDVDGLIKRTKIATIYRDFLMHYPDGGKANIYLNIAPVREGYGRAGGGGFVLVMRDITREKSLEEERDEFISVASHELRTPIAITEGNIANAQFIADKTGDMEQVKKAMNNAHTQVLFLAEMINDLSALSRAERGKLATEIKPIDVNDLIQTLNTTYGPQAAEKGLELHTEVQPNLEPLNSAELYVREILQNFITNSIKYTLAGHVTIGAKQQAHGVEFYVSDTGIGISKADQAKVFEKFFRSEDVRTRAKSGTGLGLYITMKLARLIHAEIRMASELNKGSTFSIFIPNLK